MRQGSFRFSIRRDRSKSPALSATIIVRQGVTPGAFIKTFSPVDHGVRLAFRVILPSLGIRFMAA